MQPLQEKSIPIFGAICHYNSCPWYVSTCHFCPRVGADCAPFQIPKCLQERSFLGRVYMFLQDLLRTEKKCSPSSGVTQCKQQNVLCSTETKCIRICDWVQRKNILWLPPLLFDSCTSFTFPHSRPDGPTNVITGISCFRPSQGRAKVCTGHWKEIWRKSYRGRFCLTHCGTHEKMTVAPAETVTWSPHISHHILKHNGCCL